MNDISVIGLLLLFCLLPLLPPKWVYGIDSYKDNTGTNIKRNRVSVLQVLLHQLMQLIQDLIVGILVPLSLRGAVTILIFLVVGADLYYRKGLSANGLAISIIGVIALYLDQLVQNASELDFLKGLFHYKSK